ncbi:MAG: hypothetical protein LBE31_08515 [Deltaproteobacteria bacterium]|nr:hypothetical protein [Deltaproteobacteria bacterium]
MDDIEEKNAIEEWENGRMEENNGREERANGRAEENNGIGEWEYRREEEISEFESGQIDELNYGNMFVYLGVLTPQEAKAKYPFGFVFNTLKSLERVSYFYYAYMRTFTRSHRRVKSILKPLTHLGGEQSSPLNEIRARYKKLLERQLPPQVEVTLALGGRIFLRDSSYLFYKNGSLKVDKLEYWVEKSGKWLRERFGENLLDAVFYYYRDIPKIFFMVMTVGPEGQAMASKLFGSTYYFTKLSNEYGHYFDPDFVDIVISNQKIRGPQRPSYWHICENMTMYRAVNQEPLFELACQRVTSYFEGRPPGNYLALHTPVIIEPPFVPYEGPVDKELEDLDKHLLSNHDMFQLLALKDPLSDPQSLRILFRRAYARIFSVFIRGMTALRAKQMLSSIKIQRHIGRINQLKGFLKMDRPRIGFVNRSRDVKLTNLLPLVFGAKLHKKCYGGYDAFIYWLKDGRRIWVKNSRWLDLTYQIAGDGAIELVAHLLDLPPKRDFEAVEFLVTSLNRISAMESWAYYQKKISISRATAKLKNRPLKLPKNNPSLWPHIKPRLIGRWGLNEEVLEAFYQSGFIILGALGQIFFPCILGKSAYELRLGPKGKESWHYISGSRSAAYLLPGNSQKVILTNNPLKAMFLKPLKPNDGVLVADPNISSPKLARHLVGYKAQIALDEIRPQWENWKLFRVLGGGAIEEED